MKNRPRVVSRAAPSSDSSKEQPGDLLSDHVAVPQASTIEEQLNAGISVGAMWKSARNRREAIQVSLRQYDGNAYLDARIFAMSDAGHMVPTRKGIAIGLKTLPQFAKTIGDGLRKAHALGLITAVST